MRLSYCQLVVVITVLLLIQLMNACPLTQQQLAAIPSGHILTTTTLSIGFDHNFVNEAGISEHFGSEIASVLDVNPNRVCVYDIEFDLYFVTRVLFLPDYLREGGRNPQVLMGALQEAILNPSHPIHNQLISRSIDRSKVFENATALTLVVCRSSSRLQTTDMPCSDKIIIDSHDESGSRLSILLFMAIILLTGVLVLVFVFMYTAYERQADVKHQKLIERNKKLRHGDGPSTLSPSSSSVPSSGSATSEADSAAKSKGD